MKTLLFTVLLACVACATVMEDECCKNVNPLIGTDFTGNTYPGAQVPYGQVQLSPDNGLPGWDRISGYFYQDSTIAGFSHTHLSGTGAGDLYDISFMPVTLPYKEAEEPLGIHSLFSHKDEYADAGYYSVLLKDYNIRVELTATERCGVQRYTFIGGSDEDTAEAEIPAAVFLNLRKAMNWDATMDSHVEVIDSVTVSGWRFSTGWARDQRVYFCTRFSRPFDSVTIDSEPIDSDANSVIARFDFSVSAGDRITVSTGISGVSMEGARRNLLAEVPEDDFDKYLDLAHGAWNDALSVIKVRSDDPDEIVTFYTALYHAMLAPTIYGDVDGAYLGPDRQVHYSTVTGEPADPGDASGSWTNYSTFSLWDTYRAAHPLYTLIQPARVSDMVRSLLAFYEQSGRLPVWNMWGGETDMMIGYHAVPVIVDAILKGIADVDPKEALEACVKTACADTYGGIGLYMMYGYVPFDKDDHWSLSKTMEYAYDDWCIATLAYKIVETLPADDAALEDYKWIAEIFEARAWNWRNVYNSETSFMQPLDSEGNFISGFSPDDYTEDICESNAWQYFWSVQHDVEGLIKMVGGRERFTEKLDSMFTYNPAADGDLPIFSTGMIGQYAHGNEPSHHVIYLYNAVGQPWKTQKYAARVMHELYRNDPAGLCGNEDCGQTSAWYVLSALGFYPVNPVGGVYELGSPLFPEATLNLPNGRKFKIIARNVSRDNFYVRGVKLNGKPYEGTSITHETILAGGTLEFEMGSEPAE